ncbi:MAG TPA: carbon storage regulator [Desulfotomaculum sp.]|nr:MAG: carbon storage regulator CsrA [Desulfotomaculum sp. BICA1-6]HBX23716.1 carbon storage regulator [Desulfotomaculum sp.]
MLVLTRKKHQAIMLGDHIRVVILDITEDAVKIGIDAPREITILRSELYRAVAEENHLATTIDKIADGELKKLFSNKP